MSVEKSYQVTYHGPRDNSLSGFYRINEWKFLRDVTVGPVPQVVVDQLEKARAFRFTIEPLTAAEAKALREKAEEKASKTDTEAEAVAEATAGPPPVPVDTGDSGRPESDNDETGGDE